MTKSMSMVVVGNYDNWKPDEIITEDIPADKPKDYRQPLKGTRQAVGISPKYLSSPLSTLVSTPTIEQRHRDSVDSITLLFALKCLYGSCCNCCLCCDVSLV